MAGTNNRGMDYTLKIGADFSAVEKSQKRIEAVLKRTGRVERTFNRERINAANKLLTLEKRIANERLRGMRSSSVAASAQRELVRSEASLRRGTSREAFTAPSSRLVSPVQTQDQINRAGELRDKLTQRTDVFDTKALDDINRRIDRIQGKMRKTTNPLEFRRLKRELTGVNTQVNKTIRNYDRLNRKMSMSQFATNGLSSSLMNLGRSYVSVFAIIEGATAFIRITKQIETAEVALLNAAGSAEQAAQDFEFVKQISNQLGLEMISTATAFGKFNSAAKLGGLTQAQTEKTFSDIAKAVTSASLSAERASLVFQAFQQVMSKGVLSMEEVRQQIGESLPQGMAALSRATGKTGQELFKFIESGEAISKDILPVWAAELAKISEESGALSLASNNLNAKWNRFLNQLTETVDILGNDLGIKALMMGILEVLSDITEAFNSTLKLASNLFKLIFMWNDEVGQIEDGMDKINDKLGAMQILVKFISGIWKGFIGSIKLGISFFEIFFDNLRKEGLLDAFNLTAEEFAKGKEEAKRIAEEKRQADIRKNNNAIKAAIEVNVNNEINSNNTDEILDQVESTVKTGVEKAIQDKFSQAF
jgi:tape measure domain-containing protein